ncbi:MAG: helix-turn-helix transcriptional regulator [Deltaproteobacteria bacterium]|jgi:putative molybdopterin biosynthesis protein|nr:helix-turn-helix transcriptional regulator [Deltaproteobacteria bacterium]
MTQDDSALTAEDVAKWLKVTKNTVYELVKRRELNHYKVGRKMRFTAPDVESYIGRSRDRHGLPEPQPPLAGEAPREGGLFIVCGQDQMLDVLTTRLGSLGKPGSQALRAYVGSYGGLAALYRGEAQAASSHLWDGDTDTYNVPYVRRLVPGTPCALIRLARRTQGFYVRAGNPSGIKGWEDLGRDGLVLVNREKGAGSRVLLDERLRLLGIPSASIKGYQREEPNHLEVAGAVGRGEADLGVGDMKAAAQVEGVGFVPLQQEDYDLVLKKEDMGKPMVKALLSILRSKEFKEQFRHMKGYDISSIGEIIAET